MYCPNCGAQLSEQTNFCPYCGSRLQNATTSISLLNKAVSTAEESNEYNLVLVSRGSCDAVTAGDLLEDVFGYTDAESGNLVSMAPVVVGENLTAEEAATVAQLYTEYGMQVSITDKEDKYVDLTSKAVTSVFDTAGNLLESAAAIIGALTVANRIRSYRRYKKPSLLERIFRIAFKPDPPKYRRNFRPLISPKPLAPRRTIRKPSPYYGTGRTNVRMPGERKPAGAAKVVGRPSGSGMGKQWAQDPKGSKPSGSGSSIGKTPSGTFKNTPSGGGSGKGGRRG